VTSGRHNDYYWIQWEGAFLNTLLRHVPDIVLGRYLVNTSFDSGSLTLSDEEQQQGWRTVGVLTYSPRITDLWEVPHDQYDEWLVFSKPCEVQTWQPLVNHCGVSLTDPDCEADQQKLWSQLESARPESYLAEGDRLFFITRNQQLHELALAEKELENWLGPFATRDDERIAPALLTFLASGGTLQMALTRLHAFKAQIESAFDQMKSNAGCTAAEIEQIALRLRPLARKKEDAITNQNWDSAADLRAEECAIFESVGLRLGSSYAILHTDLDKQIQELASSLSKGEKAKGDHAS
jgi:hypothetical protein